MTYQVLARKWRPQNFSNLVGQDPIVTALRNGLTEGRIAQAYLFSGIRGVGKTTAARVLAKALSCENGPAADPCNECPTCLEINAGRSMDVLEIDAATYSKVEQVRDLTEALRYGPANNRYKVVVLDEVHRLSRQAFDALLKIVEEPPAHLVFIFATTEIDSVPATILSRCQEFQFRRVPSGILAAHLRAICEAEQIEVSDAALRSIAKAGEGSVRDSVALLDQMATFGNSQIRDEDALALLGGLDTSIFHNLLGAILDGDSLAIIDLVRTIDSNGWDPNNAYRQFLSYARDALHLALGGATQSVDLSEEEAESLRERVRSFGYEPLLQVLNLLLASEPMVRRSETGALALEITWLRAAELPKVIRIQDVLSGRTDLPPQGQGGNGGGPTKGSGGGSAGRGRPPSSPGRSASASMANESVDEVELSADEPTHFDGQPGHFDAHPDPLDAAKPNFEPDLPNREERSNGQGIGEQAPPAFFDRPPHDDSLRSEARFDPAPFDPAPLEATAAEPIPAQIPSPNAPRPATSPMGLSEASTLDRDEGEESSDQPDLDPGRFAALMEVLGSRSQSLAALLATAHLEPRGSLLLIHPCEGDRLLPKALGRTKNIESLEEACQKAWGRSVSWRVSEKPWKAPAKTPADSPAASRTSDIAAGSPPSDSRAAGSPQHNGTSRLGGPTSPSPSSTGPSPSSVPDTASHEPPGFWPAGAGSHGEPPPYPSGRGSGDIDKSTLDEISSLPVVGQVLQCFGGRIERVRRIADQPNAQETRP